MMNPASRLSQAAAEAGSKESTLSIQVLAPRLHQGTSLEPAVTESGKAREA
jgi:hypothetical protein